MTTELEAALAKLREEMTDHWYSEGPEGMHNALNKYEAAIRHFAEEIDEIKALVNHGQIWDAEDSIDECLTRATQILKGEEHE